MAAALHNPYVTAYPPHRGSLSYKLAVFRACWSTFPTSINCGHLVGYADIVPGLADKKSTFRSSGLFLLCVSGHSLAFWLGLVDKV